jgi:AcrR family transcriptional regulator
LAQATGSTKALAHNEARSALVEAALRVISTEGAASMHPNELCVELGISRSLVNFHFDGRDGLVAEAMALGYERYVAELKLAADGAGPEPLARLLAWVDRQIEWTIANSGLASALNFQREASSLSGEMSPEAAGRLEQAGLRNFEQLMDLVRAVRESNGGLVDGDSVGLDSAVVGWLTLGLSVWLAGRHAPTRSLNVPDQVDIAKSRVRLVIASMVGE